MILIGFGVVIALAAAVRSTWSPCGLSMLSQISPMAEAGRGRKFGRTASWFIAGAVLGGLTLGCGIAAGSAAFAATGVSTASATAILIGAALVCGAVDSRVFGFAPPFVCRQVNQDWLLTYRSWVYGGGFGWQIGAGLTTYVMTAAVPLMIIVGVLGADPWIALALGAAFGLVRGLAVLLGTRLRTPAALTEFHRRFDALAEPVRQVVIGVQLAVAVVAAWIVAPAVVATGVTIAGIALLSWSVAHAAPAASVPSPDATACRSQPSDQEVPVRRGGGRMLRRRRLCRHGEQPQFARE